LLWPRSTITVAAEIDLEIDLGTDLEIDLGTDPETGRFKGERPNDVSEFGRRTPFPSGNPPLAPPSPAGLSYGLRMAFVWPRPSRSAWIPYTQLEEADRRARVFNEDMEKETKIGVEPELSSSGPAGPGMTCGGLSPSPSSRLARGVGAAKVDAGDASRMRGAQRCNESRSHSSPCLGRPPEDEVRRA